MRGLLCLVVMLGLSGFLRADAPCPAGCSCRDTSVDCSSRGLTSLPTAYPQATTLIDLSGNNITTIPEDAFSNLPGLQSVLLNNCNVQNLAKYAFRDLKNLKALDLSDNQIERLLSSTFYRLSFVRSNPCRVITSVFHECGLDLRKNPLQEIEQGAFSATKDADVHIGQSPVSTALMPSVGAFQDLEGADVVLTEVPMLHLHLAPFTGISNPERIRIDNSRIPQLMDAFNHIQGVKYIEMVNCTIDDVSSSIMMGTTFRGRSEYNFENTFVIRYSRIAAFLPSKMFQGSEVKKVALNGNTMLGFQKSVFSYVNVYALNLVSNKFTDQASLEPYTMGDIQASRVYLSDNSFNSIESRAFWGSKIALQLDLRGYSTLNISGFAFSNMVVAQFGFQAFNSLILQKDSLANMTGDVDLKFYETKITSFDREALETTSCHPKIRSLDIRSGAIPCDCSAADLAFFCRINDIGYFISCQDKGTLRSVTAPGEVAQWHQPSPDLPKCTAPTAPTCHHGDSAAEDIRAPKVLLTFLVVLSVYFFRE